MKIALVGSFCTGKTTIAKSIKKFGFNHIPDLARAISKEGFKLDNNSMLETEMYLLSKAIFYEKQNDHFVTETPLINILAYSQLTITDPRFIDIVTSQLINHKYDKILYMPIEFSIIKDGLRPDNVEIQKKIDEKVINVLNFLQQEYHIIKGDKKSRILQVKKILNIK